MKRLDSMKCFFDLFIHNIRQTYVKENIYLFKRIKINHILYLIYTHDLYPPDIGQVVYRIMMFFLFLVEKSLARINCLLDCLLVCPHVIDWSKNDMKTKGIIFHKTWSKVIQHGESESEVSFFQYPLFYHFYAKKLTKRNSAWRIRIRG
jgi:hypothetical protein